MTRLAGRLLRGFALALPALLAAGCLAPFRSATPAPMPSLEVTRAAAATPCTAILLPGTWDRPRHFVRHGFGALALERGASLDLVAADAHMGYYRDRSVVIRLHEDFVAPLRARGERVWLVGISLGGVGALLYAAEHAEEVAGLVLLSPFPGDPELLDEIRRAGGPLAWKPPAALGPEDWQRRVWKYLQEWHAQQGPKPEIYLAYGDSDDFAPGIELMAGLLPAGHLRHRPGGHDWKTWTRLWQDLLGGDVFAGCRADAPAGISGGGPG